VSTPRTLGRHQVSALGFGGMLLSIEGRPDRERAKATIRAAIASGITLIDTADAYHSFADDRGHNEILIAEVLRELGAAAADVVVATKGGKVRPGDGSWPGDARPEHLIASAKLSAARLGVDSIALYQLHAPDPAVPFVESLEALRDLVAQGVVEDVGVSNVSAAEVTVAAGVLGASFVSVQNQFSPTRQEYRDVLDLCEETGLAFLAWRPLGAVLQQWDTTNAADTFGVVAAAREVSVQRVILAWELSLSPAIIPIPGSTRPETAIDSAGAMALELTESERLSLASYGTVAVLP
jgi:aryl-alcohol dehydrogenase-like predicted oxidoreductase